MNSQTIGSQRMDCGLNDIPCQKPPTIWHKNASNQSK